MTNIKLQQKDYNDGGATYQLVLPIDYEVIIPTNDSVRLLNLVIEGMDLSKLYAEYSSLGRKPVTSPKTLFKIVVYGYMEQNYSSRGIESASLRDVNYMWLRGGEPAPDHSTISRFRKDRLGEIIESLFYQFVEELCSLGEVQYENVFADGTKLEANANRYTFVWKKALEKNESKMHEKANAIAEELNKLYLTSYQVTDENADSEMYKMIKYLETKMSELGREKVTGRGKSKSNEQKLLEVLVKYRNRQGNYDISKDVFDGRNSYSKTDPDATFMRMKDDHMKNGQLKPGYNVQFAVESEYVIGVGLFSDCNDLNTLIPLLENMRSFIPSMHIKNLTLDSGYESEENYLYLDGRKVTYYIKPQNYEQQKKRKYKSDISKRENMAYNSETDEYTCANGKPLKPIRTVKKKSKTGYESEVTVYECESCEDCPHKEKCTKAKGNRQMQVSKTFLSKRADSLENITTEKGILLRINRSIQSEGAFGILKQDRHFTRFLTRGTQNVKTETLLLCLGFNINKLHAKIQAGRCGKDLHIPKAA
jgi:transposase